MVEIELEDDTPIDWEIDRDQLKIGPKLASDVFDELYRGTYCGQNVAIKILKPDHSSQILVREFLEEIAVMKNLRHKNVIQFIGACTKSPNLLFVTEFLSGGSLYDFLHKHYHSRLQLPKILRTALDVSEGMDYLHQNNIIHRDLKAANLVMDEDEVVKVTDYEVARVQEQRGIVTAKTGTYRWMAPEVIEHKKYDRKVDVFSFGVVLWELLTGRLPYDDMTAFQAAIAVVQNGLRPTVPKDTNPTIAHLLERCWKSDPALRPEFAEITVTLQAVLKDVEEGEHSDEQKVGDKKGFFSALKSLHR